MRLAIPTTEGLLDAHFGHCRQFTIFDISSGRIQRTTRLDAPPHQPGLLPAFLSDRNITDVVAGGIGHKAILLFNQYGINVHAGAPVRAVEELAEGFLNKSIEFNENLCDQKAHSCK